MNELKINTWLICITVQASQEQWAQVFKFLDWKKASVNKLLCITTSGRESWSKFNEIKLALYEKEVPHTSFGLMSKPQPDVPATYTRLEMALSFQHRDSGVLLISELPLEEVFKPIQVNLMFGDKDLGFEIGGEDNNERLVEFVLSLRSNPELIIYDAQSQQFIK